MIRFALFLTFAAIIALPLGALTAKALANVAATVLQAEDQRF